MAQTAKPYGRDEAMAELLVAARQLIAERGFDAVGVRDIAALANVNHALVHRHFGTKENLFREVMRAEKSSFAELAGDTLDPGAALERLYLANAADVSFTRILASAMLSDLSPREWVPENGTLKRISDSLAEHLAATTEGNEDSVSLEAKARTAVVTALALGWVLLEPFLAAAVEIGDDQLPAVRDRVHQLVKDLTETPGTSR